MISNGVQNGIRKSQSRGTRRSMKDKENTRKENIKKIPKSPPVPSYVLKTGKEYDVIGTHTSVRAVQYTGYETIGHLILYCFLKGNQPYKFSEIEIRKGGGIQESDTGLSTDTVGNKSI